MSSKPRSAIILTVLCCLIFGQPIAVNAQQQPWAAGLIQSDLAGRTKATSAQATPEQYADAFDLALRIMQHKLLYSVINTEFAPATGVAPDVRPLALSQIVYMLTAAQTEWKSLNAYITSVPGDAPASERESARAQMKPIFDTFLGNKVLLEKLTRHNDPTQPLQLETKGQVNGYSKIRMFVNHPSLEDPNKPSGDIIPADNLRSVLTDFIDGAETEIWYNAFDVDLPEFGEALLNAKKRSVFVMGGVDKKNYDSKPEVREVMDELIKAGTKDFNTKIVDSVGLNHQKVVMRDPFGPNAAVLFLSGNFTQSCLGPEGDAIGVSENVRPAYSIPNANHAILIEGKLPAVVVRQELKKVLEYDVRGQSQFPMGGAFQIRGPRDPVTGKATWIILTFSPNGGRGDINRDVLASLFKSTTGKIEAVHFAFSSQVVENAVVEHTTREAKRLKAMGRPAKDLFKSVGDTPFAMRDWSAFLNLAGYGLDLTTRRYSELKDPPMRDVLNNDEYENWQTNIRVGPAIYGDRIFRLPEAGNIRVTAKVHHKVFVLPRENISVVGTSFNPSENAETNNEQVILVKDSGITQRTRGMLGYLFKESRSSVRVEAERRNKNPRPEKQPDDLEDRELEKKIGHTQIRELKGSSTPLTPLSSGRSNHRRGSGATCLSIFGP